MDKQWVWFDLDDTLHDYSYVAAETMAFMLHFISQGAGLPLDVVERQYRQVFKQQDQHHYIDGRVSHAYRRERLQAAIEGTLLVNVESERLIQEALRAYERVYMDNLRLKQGAVELVRVLVDQGYALAILTDAPHDSQLRVLDRLGLRPFFDELFTAGDLRVSKANGMMAIVLDRLQLAPEHVIMIGDSLERDIWPARDAGIRSIWFNEKRSLNEQGYTEVQTLEQIPKLLGL